MFKKIKNKPLVAHVKLLEKNAPYYKYRRAYYVHETELGVFYYSEKPLTLLECSFYTEKDAIPVVATFVYDNEPKVEYVPETKQEKVIVEHTQEEKVEQIQEEKTVPAKKATPSKKRVYKKEYSEKQDSE